MGTEKSDSYYDELRRALNGQTGLVQVLQNANDTVVSQFRTELDNLWSEIKTTANQSLQPELKAQKTPKDVKAANQSANEIHQGVLKTIME
jgi:hypothetical protein